MLEIQFYHLTSTPLDRALPRLLEKSLQAEFRVKVKLASEEQVEALNNMLWTYNPDSFLPHGSKADGYGEHQPVYLTSGEEDPNNATLLIMTDGTAAQPSANVKRVLDIFDGNDEAMVTSARMRWKAYQAQGFTVAYIKQNASGGWEKMAS